MGTNPSHSYVSLALELGGKPVTGLRSLQLPGYQVEQVVVATGPGHAARLGANISISAMEAEFDLLQQDALSDWALSLAQGSAQPTDGAALLLDQNYAERRRVEWSGGLITALKFPKLDAREAKTPFRLGIQWLPATVSYAKASGKVVKLPAAKNKKAALTANFRVLGLPFDASFVASVSLPTVTAKLAEEGIGDTRLLVRSYAQVDLGELKIEVLARTREEILAWVQKLIDDGRIADSEYLGLDIELLDPTLKKVLLSLQLSGCDLLAYEEGRLEAGSAALETVVLRFGVGRLDLKIGA